jgi:hypothetical protein
VRHAVDRAAGPGTAASRWAGRAVDRPVFWWGAGAVFLANAGLSVAEDRWPVALLQLLTAVWAFVAGMTAHERPASSGSGGPRPGSPAAERSAEVGHDGWAGDHHLP